MAATVMTTLLTIAIITHCTCILSCHWLLRPTSPILERITMHTDIIKPLFKGLYSEEFYYKITTIGTTRM